MVSNRNFRFKTRDLRSLTFGVFGIVTDWRTTVICEGQELGRAMVLNIKWVEFADAANSLEGMPWLNIDVPHRMSLDDLLGPIRNPGQSEAKKDHLNRVWHRLDLWPDAKPSSGWNLCAKVHCRATLERKCHPADKHGEARRSPWDCIPSRIYQEHTGTE